MSDQKLVKQIEFKFAEKFKYTVEGKGFQETDTVMLKAPNISHFLMDDFYTKISGGPNLLKFICDENLVVSKTDKTIIKIGELNELDFRDAMKLVGAYDKAFFPQGEEE